MPANNKPLVDWHRARVPFEAGWNPPSIAKLFTEEGAPVSRQAIAKRANKEGWERQEEEAASPAPAAPPARQAAPARTAGAFLVPLTAEAEAALVESLQNGCTEKIAANCGQECEAKQASNDKASGTLPGHTKVP